MGTILASAIIGKVRNVLEDLEPATRWYDAELLGALSMAQRETVFLKPDAYTMVKTIPLVAGTKQPLPAGAHLLINILRNRGATTPLTDYDDISLTDYEGVVVTDHTALAIGNRITRLDRMMLDLYLPDWHSHTASTTVLVYCYDQKKAKDTFWVYPPQPAATTWLVDGTVSQIPADVDALDDPIELDDLYEAALVNYMIFRALSKDNESGDHAKATAYYQAFLGQLGMKSNMDDLMAGIKMQQAAPSQGGRQ